VRDNKEAGDLFFDLIVLNLCLTVLLTPWCNISCVHWPTLVRRIVDLNCTCIVKLVLVGDRPN
jgi:hypothetical protein